MEGGGGHLPAINTITTFTHLHFNLNQVLMYRKYHMQPYNWISAVQFVEKHVRLHKQVLEKFGLNRRFQITRSDGISGLGGGVQVAFCPPGNALADCISFHISVFESVLTGTGSPLRSFGFLSCIAKLK